MTGFSWGVQLVCLGALGALLVYTLALVRLGRLSARVTVSWILADLVAIAAILLWGRLPVFAYTSTLGDRELLVVLAVLLFAYVSRLMLDSLERISVQSTQITRLAQQLALLQESMPAPPVSTPTTEESLAAPTRDTPYVRRIVPPRPPLRPGLVGQIALAAWLVLCFGLYVAEAYGRLPPWLLDRLGAVYKQ
jgi:hypothetical protein